MSFSEHQPAPNCMAWKAKKQQQQNRKQNTRGLQLFPVKLPTETLAVLPQKHFA